jgi:hypothetical protein
VVVDIAAAVMVVEVVTEDIIEIKEGMKLRIVCLLIFALYGQANSQNFAIKRVEVSGGLMHIYYDLIDTVAEHAYTVNVFSSKDNFISRLDKVTGDLGLEVRPGIDKKISWNSHDELSPAFEGTVSLEVRGSLYVPFICVERLYKKIKRAQPCQITWRGGTEQNILNFDLYRGDEKITGFRNIANVGHYTFILPAFVKPGSDYYFKITDTKNKDQIVNSTSFAIE